MEKKVEEKLAEDLKHLGTQIEWLKAEVGELEDLFGYRIDDAIKKDNSKYGSLRRYLCIYIIT
jgi:hypothetical protein